MGLDYYPQGMNPWSSGLWTQIAPKIASSSLKLYRAQMALDCAILQLIFKYFPRKTPKPPAVPQISIGFIPSKTESTPVVKLLCICNLYTNLLVLYCGIVLCCFSAVCQWSLLVHQRWTHGSIKYLRHV